MHRVFSRFGWGGQDAERKREDAKHHPRKPQHDKEVPEDGER